jgi:malate dehydrogenase (oxaloacetate-decarboxylating)
MLVSVSYAIAEITNDAHLNENYIIPKVNDPRILPTVTNALRDAIQKHVTKRDHLAASEET